MIAAAEVKRMIDLRLGDPSVTVLGRDRPPVGYDGTTKLILASPRGGLQEYIAQTATPSFTVKCYAPTEYDALLLGDQLWAAIHEQRSAPIICCAREVEPATLIDQATQWPFALTYYTVHLRRGG